jgi:multicopper oxidase
MHRSTFLAAAASTLVLPLPALARAAAEADVAEYVLTAAPRTFAPLAGVRFDGLAYNAAIPGPVLRVRRGQRLRVHFHNRAGVPTAVHWHGMILPNAMDGAAGITQRAVEDGGSFLYEFNARPAGTRWYHDHAMGVTMGLIRGLFGMLIVEDPHDDKADAEFAVVLHDVAAMNSVDAALHGTSAAPMVDPGGSPELRAMRSDDRMGDEVTYVAHCINGAAYPQTAKMAVKVGDKVRLRVLNANPTQAKYVRLAGHRLHVTHADGNPLAQPLDVDALRVGVAERYDAWFEVRAPGAWLLQTVSSDPLAFEQAAVVHTPGMADVSPLGSPGTLDGVSFFTYEKAGGLLAGPAHVEGVTLDRRYVLDGGKYGSSRWTMDGKVWPHTAKIEVKPGDRVVVRFRNETDMHHPMHLHGHTFRIVEVNGRALARPLAKDVALVDPHGGTLAWAFDATSPPGRWLLHCHNDIHMMDGMMTEVVYR